LGKGCIAVVDERSGPLNAWIFGTPFLQVNIYLYFFITTTRNSTATTRNSTATTKFSTATTQFSTATTQSHKATTRSPTKSPPQFTQPIGDQVIQPPQPFQPQPSQTFLDAPTIQQFTTQFTSQLFTAQFNTTQSTIQQFTTQFTSQLFTAQFNTTQSTIQPAPTITNAETVVIDLQQFPMELVYIDIDLRKFPMELVYRDY
ncbi:17072_t:CDS:2, partial [Cetraspora pellucida]